MVCSLPKHGRDWRNCLGNVFEHLGGGCQGCWLSWLIFWLTLWAQCLPVPGYFGLDPPCAKRAPIFKPCEWFAACQSLAETGETAQRMFSSTWEETGKVAGRPSRVSCSHLWRNPSQIWTVLRLTPTGAKGTKLANPVSGLQPVRGQEGPKKRLQQSFKAPRQTLQR